jgi:hypothetical protein
MASKLLFEDDKQQIYQGDDGNPFIVAKDQPQASGESPEEIQLNQSPYIAQDETPDQKFQRYQDEIKAARIGSMSAGAPVAGFDGSIKEEALSRMEAEKATADAAEANLYNQQVAETNKAKADQARYATLGLTPESMVSAPESQQQPMAPQAPAAPKPNLTQQLTEQKAQFKDPYNTMMGGFGEQRKAIEEGARIGAEKAGKEAGYVQEIQKVQEQ